MTHATIYDRAKQIGNLGSALYESSGYFCYGIAAIHRGDFLSAWWFLAMGGFCPDESAQAHSLWNEQSEPRDEAVMYYRDEETARQTALFSPDVTARNGGGR